MENLIERKLSSAVRQAGGIAIKFFPVSLAGMPDRLVLCPRGGVCWVELKDKGKKPRSLQTYRHDKLRKLNQVVFVVDDEAGIKRVVEYVGHH